jgi:hypothetical protein
MIDVRDVGTVTTREGVAIMVITNMVPFATALLLESAPRESFTGVHEDLSHLPADLFR